MKRLSETTSRRPADTPSQAEGGAATCLVHKLKVGWLKELGVDDEANPLIPSATGAAVSS